MLSNLRLSQKGLLLVIIPFAFELFFFAMIWYFLHAAEEARNEQAKSGKLIDQAIVVTTKIYDSGRTLATCWYTNDFSKVSDGKLKSDMTGLEEHFKLLWELTSGNHRQRERVEKIQQKSRQMMNMFITEVLPSIAEGEVAGTSDVSYFGQRADSFYTPLIQQVHELIQEEKKHFERIAIKAYKQDQYAKGLIVVALCLSIVITFAMVIFFTFSITRRLEVISDNVDKFANRKPLNFPVDGTDEISQVDQEFRAMAQKVLAAEASKQEFLSMISHDMRTPLSALQGTLAVAAMGTYGQLNEYGVERMEKAEANVGRLIALINDLLDVERIESGLLQLSIADEELWELVSNAVDTVAPVADQKNVQLTNNCEEVFLRCDARRIEQILVNLIANSVKFSPDETEIVITSELVGEQVKVSVIDQGRGISAEKQEQIFQRFEQAEESDTRKGYGLGLAIAKSLVEAHHGTIGVYSVPGEGATFWFTLPLDQPHPS
jgi:signal transduction histidine kinase